jgi:hypothetical protein
LVVKNGVNRRFNVEAPAARLAPAREQLQVADDVARPPRGVARVLERLEQARAPHWIGLAEALDVAGHEIDVQRHHRERVVDLVRDAGRERAHRHHAVGDQQLLLRAHALGDVAQDQHHALDAARAADGRAAVGDQHLAAVGRAQRRRLAVGHHLPAREQRARRLGERLGERLPAELGERAPEQRLGHRVHAHDPAALVGGDDRVADARERDREAALALDERVLREQPARLGGAERSDHPPGHADQRDRERERVQRQPHARAEHARALARDLQRAEADRQHQHRRHQPPRQRPGRGVAQEHVERAVVGPREQEAQAQHRRRDRRVRRDRRGRGAAVERVRAEEVAEQRQHRQRASREREPLRGAFDRRPAVDHQDAARDREQLERGDRRHRRRRQALDAERVLRGRAAGEGKHAQHARATCRPPKPRPPMRTIAAPASRKQAAVLGSMLPPCTSTRTSASTPTREPSSTAAPTRAEASPRHFDHARSRVDRCAEIVRGALAVRQASPSRREKRNAPATAPQAAAGRRRAHWMGLMMSRSEPPR